MWNLSERAKSDNEKCKVLARLRVYNRRPVEHFRRVYGWRGGRSADLILPRMVDPD